MYKIIDTAVMSDGTKIQLEDWHSENSEEYGDEDIVIYMVSEKELNIWAQKNYNFVFNFLHKVEENEYNVYPLLNDRFFGYNFTDAFDHILYGERDEGTMIMMRSSSL